MKCTHKNPATLEAGNVLYDIITQSTGNTVGVIGLGET